MATKDMKKLDVGGIVTTLQRILTYCKKMREIRAERAEFIEKTLSGEFKKEEDEVNEQLARYGFKI